MGPGSLYRCLHQLVGFTYSRGSEEMRFLEANRVTADSCDIPMVIGLKLLSISINCVRHAYGLSSEESALDDAHFISLF